MIAVEAVAAAESSGLRQRLLERHGVEVLDPAHGGRLERAIRAVALSQGVRVEEVVAARSPVLLRELAAELTFAESHFFRPTDIWERAAEKLAARVESAGSARVLSAGCCRGEEPYSLAIALLERAGRQVADAVSIVGCDVSSASIAAAREATFAGWSFRDARAARTRSRYFDPEGPDRWRLRPPLRGAVRFEHCSVQEYLAHAPAGVFDLILFRNVAVYFAREAIGPVHGLLQRALSSDGWLCVAPTDPVPTAMIAVDTALGLYRTPLLAASHRPVPGSPTSLDRALQALRAGALESATMQLRALLYLDPGHAVARRWYAVALARAGDPRAATQRTQLLQLLDRRRDDERLEDGLTTAAALRAALRSDEENGT